MADQDQAERTEPATPRKREEARKRGEVAQSRDLSAAVLLAAGFGVAVSGAGADFLRTIAVLCQAAWSGAWVRPDSVQDAHALLLGIGARVGLAALPLVAVLVATAVVAPLVQTGPMFSAEALSVRWSKLDPIAGMKRFFAPERVFDLAKSLFKLGVVVAVVWAVVAPELDRVLGLGAVPLAAVVELQRDLAVRILLAVVVALGLLGVADLAWVRWRHEEKLKMSLREVRDELRQREGSPEMRGRLRAAQRELSQSRMLAEVATADVVVRNPTHFAVALRYERERMQAPVVVARGRNKVALRIIAAAEEHGVPVVENRVVARLLFQTVKPGQPIPENLYEVVAEILASVYRADRRFAARMGGAGDGMGAGAGAGGGSGS